MKKLSIAVVVVLVLALVGVWYAQRRSSVFSKAEVAARMPVDMPDSWSIEYSSEIRDRGYSLEIIVSSDQRPSLSRNWANPTFVPDDPRNVDIYVGPAFGNHAVAAKSISFSSHVSAGMVREVVVFIETDHGWITTYTKQSQ
ncbi:MAG: hypothetical protein HUU19_08260 [Phycisphaerales bacterium]|nr:hypothetical protein [Phycisphaerales bacterium]